MRLPAENITRRDFARGALAVTGLAVAGCGRSVRLEASPAEGAAYPKWSGDSGSKEVRR